ncbi:MAG: hypothetical protein GY835_00540 [bacterium]|nr:hypothetical protein [bacterium]
MDAEKVTPDQVKTAKEVLAQAAEQNRGKRTRLSVYLPRPGMLTRLKMIAVSQSDQEGRVVRVNDLVVEAINLIIDERLPVTITGQEEDKEAVEDIFDRMQLVHPTHPDAAKINPEDVPTITAEDLEGEDKAPE